MLAILAFMGYLDYKSIELIKFASNMFFEVYNDTNSYSIKLVYNGNTINSTSYNDFKKFVHQKAFSEAAWGRKCHQS